MEILTLYHGSSTRIEQPVIQKAKYSKNFGQGFYCTTIREQAERWARRYNRGIVNTYKVTIHNNLNILEFKEMTEEWLDFIVQCRNNRSHEYDIVIGAMANDQMYNFIADFMDGIITREQFWVMAKFKYPTHQINFCTNKAIQCLDFTRSTEI